MGRGREAESGFVCVYVVVTMNTSVVRNATRREGKAARLLLLPRRREVGRTKLGAFNTRKRERERSEAFPQRGTQRVIGITTKDDIYDAFLLVYGSLSSAALMSNSGRYPPIFIERVRESKRVRE